MRQTFGFFRPSGSLDLPVHLLDEGVLPLASDEITTQWSQPKVPRVLNTVGMLSE